MDVMAVAEGVTETLTGGKVIGEVAGSFTEFLSGIGSGIVEFFKTLFVDANGNMTVFSIVALAFIGLGLSTMVARKIMGMIRK